MGADMLTRLRVLLIGAFGLSLMLLPPSSSGGSPASTTLDAAQGRPNIVLVLVDDARYDDLSTMPRVRQQIGAAGARLHQLLLTVPAVLPCTRNAAHRPVRPQSRCPEQPRTDRWLREKMSGSTLATWLDPTYRTGLIGKYFNGAGRPTTGLDEWMVPSAMYNYTGSRSWCIDQGAGGAFQSRVGYRSRHHVHPRRRLHRPQCADEPAVLPLSLDCGPPCRDPPDPGDMTGLRVRGSSRSIETGSGSGNADPSFDEADVSDKPVQIPALRRREIVSLTEHDSQRRESELSVEDAITGIWKRWPGPVSLTTPT